MISYPFANELREHVSDLNLLNHEFYQKWNEGSIPLEILREYAKQYYHHVRAFPRYISATHAQCPELKARQALLENLIDEERGEGHHPGLWLKFGMGIGATEQEMESTPPSPEIQALIRCFFESAQSSYAEGLGALFAYEHQVPAVAKFKAEALEKHYGVSGEPSKFFHVHQEADVFHTETLSQLLQNLTEEQKALCKKATRVTAERLWKFLDSMNEQMKHS